MTMNSETLSERSTRIIDELNARYPRKRAYDLDGRGEHFVCEVEPVEDHPEYDRAVEVIISTKPHKHLKMTQKYTVLSGTLKLHVGEKTVVLNTYDTYIVEPGNVHWAEGDDKTFVDIHSTPGWTKEDHINV